MIRMKSSPAYHEDPTLAALNSMLVGLHAEVTACSTAACWHLLTRGRPVSLSRHWNDMWFRFGQHYSRLRKRLGP